MLTSLRHLPMASWMCSCIAFCHLDSSAQKALNYFLYDAKQAPACFEAVLTEFMLSEGLLCEMMLRLCGSSAISSLFSIMLCLLMMYITAQMTLQCIARFANDLRKSLI